MIKESIIVSSVYVCLKSKDIRHTELQMDSTDIWQAL